MAIEGVNNNVSYTAAEQSKYTSNSKDATVEVSSAADTKQTVKVANDNASASKDNSANTKEQGKHIKSAVDQANQQIRNKRTRCEFKYYEDTNRVAIKVIDRDTDKVIREIPPEETLEMVEKMWELAGLIVDEKR